MVKNSLELNNQEREELAEWVMTVFKNPEKPHMMDGENEFSAVDIAKGIREGVQEDIQAALLLRQADTMSEEDFCRKLMEELDLRDEVLDRGYLSL